MTALALLALGLHDLLDAVLPGAWPTPRRRWLARAGAAVAAVLAAVLVAVLAPTGISVAVGGGLVALLSIVTDTLLSRAERLVRA